MRPYSLISMVILGLVTTAAAQNAADPAPREQIAQFGITWTFDRPYPAGQYANGDWWVVGPVNIIRIDPASREVDGRTRHGSMINPSPRLGTRQGYDSTLYRDRYDPALNVALDVSPDRPLTVAVNSSLVSTITREEAQARPQLETCAILTVVAEAPAAGSFRPPYSGEDKSPRYNLSQLQWDRLPQLEPTQHTPELATVERWFERPWLDHVPDWMGRDIHPRQNMPDYGRDLTTHVSVGGLMLLLDLPREQKQTLLVRYMQLGIDLHGIVQDGGERNWVPNGGHAGGRKWPIVFAGLVLDDQAMQTAQFASGEDGQTYYGQGWTGARALWGIRHSTSPNLDHEHLHPSEWTVDGRGQPGDPRAGANSHARGESYRHCCTAFSWVGVALAARLMDAMDVWNHPAFFDYTDRWMTEDWAPFEQEIRETLGRSYGMQGRTSHPFMRAMWDAYRGEVDPAGWQLPTDQRPAQQ
jgi:hypothetical protein